MGESSACLLGSFSQPSPVSQESREDDPIRRALTSSISFGRFMSDSLAWEKWSSFSQNRYLEEAEKYSKSGSVAEKKAYFEAHYKKIAAKKAAVLLEQQSPAVDDMYVENLTNENDYSSPTERELAGESEHTNETTNAEILGGNTIEADVLISVDPNQHALPEERTEGQEQTVEISFFGEEIFKSPNEVHVEVNLQDEKEAKTPDPSTLPEPATSDKNEAAFSSEKKSARDQVSKIRSFSKPNIPIYPRKGDHASNAVNKKTATQSLEKKGPTSQSVHMSIDLTSRATCANKISSPLPKKIVARTSEESFILLTQTKVQASVGGLSNHHTAKPQPGNFRTENSMNRSLSGSISRSMQFNSSSLDITKSKPVCGSKLRSPILSSSFCLRSEERAAKRKEFFQKVEQKLNAKESEKSKAKGGSNDVLKSISSMVEANTNFQPMTKSASIVSKKISAQSYSPNIGRKSASEVQDSSSRPPWRLSMKTDSFSNGAEKNFPKMIMKKTMLENTSPNIRLHTDKEGSKTNICRRLIKE